MTEKQQKAIELHQKGYNCFQAVACTFAEELGVAEETAFRMGEGFGLGMGDMSQTCGAVTGDCLHGNAEQCRRSGSAQYHQAGHHGAGFHPDGAIYRRTRQLHLPGAERQNRLPGSAL